MIRIFKIKKNKTMITDEKRTRERNIMKKIKKKLDEIQKEREHFFEFLK